MVEGALSDSPNKESRGRVFRRVRDALGGQGVIVRFVPDGLAEMHVKMSDFSGVDAFDDLPGQGGQGADNADCPGDTASRLDGTEGGHTVGTPPSTARPCNDRAQRGCPCSWSESMGLSPKSCNA